MGKKGAGTGLLDDVLTAVKNQKPGMKTWFDRLPADAQEQLSTVRETFDPTKHQKKAFANAIIQAATSRGWQTGGVQAVLAWLDGKR